MMIGSVANSGAGVAMTLNSLTRALRQRAGVSVEVFSMSNAEEVDAARDWAGIELHHHKVVGPRAFGYAPALGRSLAGRPIDLLHLHGLWMYCSAAAGRWAVRSGRPCLISPRGMLDAWALANSSWKKRLARWLYEDANLRGAACLHALCEPERQAIRDFGLTGPVCVIPNGVDPMPEASPPAEWRRALPAEAPVLLYLGRLHPKKRVLELIQAWYLAQDIKRSGAAAWHLVIAGPGPADYVQLLKKHIAQLGLGAQVHLIGPQYGIAKQATLAAADAFVLASLSEGMPNAVLEAWSSGLPTLITPQCNLPEGFAAGAALMIEPEPAVIAAGLRRLFALSEQERRAMGRKGRELVNERFTWERVAAEFDTVYRWLLGNGDRPACVDIV